MSNKHVKESGGSIGFLGILQLIFITLKLIDKIDWSWFWVLSPIWIPASIAILLLIIFGIIYLIKR